MNLSRKGSRFLHLKGLILFCLWLCSFSAWGHPDIPKGSKVVPIAKVDDVIWGMDWVSKEEILLSLKSGDFWLVSLKDIQTTGLAKVTRIGELPPSMGLIVSGQGGLLDVKKSPHFQSDREVYFTYSKSGKEGKTTALGRFRLDSRTTKPQDFRDIYVANAWGHQSIHFGSRIAFGNDNSLYISVGDRGDRDRAQDLTVDNGKILRLNLDGTIPKDNPFRSRPEAGQAIYSLGHRNPQGLYFDEAEKSLFSSEHGPRGGDEINRIRAGENYGWPIVTFGREYSGPPIGKGNRMEGMVQPEKVYVPSIAPSSLIRIQRSTGLGKKGSFILGALVLQHLNVVSADFKTEDRYLEGMNERVRNVLENPEGGLYISTDTGWLYRIEPEISKSK